MADFLYRNYVYVPGFRVKDCEQFRRAFIIPSGSRVPGEAASVEQEAAVTNPSCFTLDPLNLTAIINDKIIFMAVTERERYQITRLNKRGEYFRLGEGALFSSFH